MPDLNEPEEPTREPGEDPDDFELRQIEWEVACEHAREARADVEEGRQQLFSLLDREWGRSLRAELEKTDGYESARRRQDVLALYRLISAVIQGRAVPKMGAGTKMLVEGAGEPEDEPEEAPAKKAALPAEHRSGSGAGEPEDEPGEAPVRKAVPPAEHRSGSGVEGKKQPGDAADQMLAKQTALPGEHRSGCSAWAVRRRGEWEGLSYFNERF